MLYLGDSMLDVRTQTYSNIHGRICLVVYTKPYTCRGSCLFCIKQRGMPRSYTENEDTKRAKLVNWDAYRQLQILFELHNLGLQPEPRKIDITILGGSFTAHSRRYLEDFVKGLYDYLNQIDSENLDHAKSLQGQSANRCVVLSVETRPDLIDDSWCDFLLRLGVTKVELGAQSLDDSVLTINRRGHTVADTISAVNRLKNFGFKVGLHLMIGLPGATRCLDMETLTTRVWAPEICPDYLKIYPFINVPHMLDANWREGVNGWSEVTEAEYVGMLSQAKPVFPPYVKINRIQRIFPEDEISIGPRKEINRSLFDSCCRCIYHRTRRIPDIIEAGKYRTNTLPQGNGLFIEAIDSEDNLLGFVRVHFDKAGHHVMVREIRIYGSSLPIGSKETGVGFIQHQGIGKHLMRIVKTIAEQRQVNEILVNAAIGARGYFEKLGYTQRASSTYMVLNVGSLTVAHPKISTLRPHPPVKRLRVLSSMQMSGDATHELDR